MNWFALEQNDVMAIGFWRAGLRPVAPLVAI